MTTYRENNQLLQKSLPYHMFGVSVIYTRDVVSISHNNTMKIKWKEWVFSRSLKHSNFTFNDNFHVRANITKRVNTSFVQFQIILKTQFKLRVHGTIGFIDMPKNVLSMSIRRQYKMSRLLQTRLAVMIKPSPITFSTFLLRKSKRDAWLSSNVDMRSRVWSWMDM